MPIKNQPMHAECSSTNASSGALLTLYVAGNFGSSNYDLDDVNDFMVITDVTISVAAGGLTSLFCDTDGTPTNVGPGESIFQGTLASNQLVNIRFNTPFVTKKGKNLVFIAPSGQANCQVQGFIKQNPNSTIYPTATPDGNGSTTASGDD